jgi:hypothetical protein
MRGRASLLTALFATVVEGAARNADVSLAALPMIFGSAYGEMATTLALLEQLFAGDGQLSPAKFQASVHNTAAGQLSIALGNPQFSTSLAAGYDTVAMSLLEAWALCSQRPGAVLVACAEEGAKAVLQPTASYAPLAAAFVLGLEPGPRPLARLELVSPVEAPGRGEGQPEARDIGNPCAPALSLARAVFSGQGATLDLNDRSPGGYSVVVQSIR